MNQPTLRSVVQVGSQLGPVEVTLDRATLVRYAGASGDFNPIHWSDRTANAADLPGVIAHGMWTMGTAIQLVVDWVGDPGRVEHYAVRFTRPLPVPPTGEVTLEVSGLVTDIVDGRAQLALSVTLDGQKLLGGAKATVRL